MRFVPGHELGHHYRGHTQFRRVLITQVLRPLQLSASFSRAQEYTADRVGAYLCVEGSPGMHGLFAGFRRMTTLRTMRREGWDTHGRFF